MTQRRTVRPFGIRDKLGYLFGDFGNDFTFILSTMILMKFYTDVIGITPGHVGLVMMASRFVDAVTDVTMGRLVDRLKPGRGGKFRRWLLWMSGPVAVASFLMYQSAVAGIASYAVRLGYLFVTYILWGSVFYTAVNIPYGSMASAISPETGDRQSLSTFRSMGATLAGLVIGVLLPLLAYEKVTVVDLATGQESVATVLDGARVTVAAGVFSVLAVVCYLLCYALTTERVRMDSPVQEKRSVTAMLRGALGNRALLSLIAASVVMLLAQLTMQSMAAYIYPDYYGSPAAQSASSLVMVAASLVAAGFAKPLSSRYGKAEVAVAANVFAALVCILTYFLRPQNVWVFVALQTLNWLGLGMFSMVSWALVTDVIDYSELRSGVREDGSVYALYSFARKLGQAASAGLSGWLLGLVGYRSAADGLPVQQSQTALNGVFGIATLVPALGFALLAAILWLWYPLRKRQVEENAAILKARHENR